MIHQSLIAPKSIVVVGGSDNPNAPGGKILENLIKNQYKGQIFVVNPKKDKVRDLPTFKDVRDLPAQVDTAIIAISAKYVLETVTVLTEDKGTRGFIIISAGFSDTGEEGKKLERQIVKQIEKYGGSLLGPNNIGLINQNYAGVFTTPVPQLDSEGIDLISGSGATAVFIMEAAMQLGFTFNSVWSVGNSAQIGVEEVLEYLDEKYTLGSSRIIMLYIESIRNPAKLLKHSSSLIAKGNKIVAIKAGSSEAGSRAASSHTGALASSDLAVDALFDKAGIIRAYGRSEMIYLAAVLRYDLPLKNRMAIVTHAGGPGVMLTDVLEKNGIEVPEIKAKKAEELLQKLYPGSSVTNPIDFLATGTAEQLDEILTAVENDFDQIDAISVIFGSPGLFRVYEVYDVLMKHIEQSRKPIYPILPSVVNVADEIDYFHQKGYAGFPDEVLFGQAFAKTYHHLKKLRDRDFDILTGNKINQYTKRTFKKGYLPPQDAYHLLKDFDIPVVKEAVFTHPEPALEFAKDKFPVVLKAAGLLHKSDAGGVRLNINNEVAFKKHFKELMQIPQAKGVLVQAQKHGLELFVGVKQEKNFGHLILFGAGGIYIEILKDFQAVLAPATHAEIRQKLQQLQIYPLLKGVRGQKGIDTEAFVNLILKVSDLVITYPEIVEMDLNPVIATPKELFVVDNRIRVE